MQLETQQKSRMAAEWADPPAETARMAALRNLSELDVADTVVVLTTGELARGGRHFETGYAHGLRKRVVLIAVVEHAFHHLEGIEVLANEEDAVLAIAAAVEHSRVPSSEA